jgi:hypothetical protein
MDTSPGFYKKSMIVFLVLWLVTLGVLAKILIKGKKPSADNRKEVVLLPGERDLVLSEMRILLKSLGDISNGLSQNDFAVIGITAKATGTARLESLPKEIAKKLPPELLNMAVEVHKGFDELADMVKDSKDSQMVNKKIGQITQSCVACHAIYKISAEE